MPNRLIEAILVPPPFVDTGPSFTGAEMLRHNGIQGLVTPLPYESATSANPLKQYLDNKVRRVRANKGKEVPIFLIGMAESSPIVGVVVLINPEVKGAVLVSPPGSVVETKDQVAMNLVHDDAIDLFDRTYRTAEPTMRSKISILTPAGATPGTKYLSELDHAEFNLPDDGHLTRD